MMLITKRNLLKCRAGIGRAVGARLRGRRPARPLLLTVTVLALLMSVVGLVSADYIGPNRTATQTVWERQYCNYRAYTAVAPAGWCYLTLYFSPGSCPSTSSVAAYFNRTPSACGSGWPGTCGTIACSIDLLSGGAQGCSAAEQACTSRTVTVTLPPATVSGSTTCSLPGNSGWCRGTGTLNLSGSEPVAGQSLTYFEGTNGTLCSAPSCAWTFPEGITSLSYWVHSTYGDTSTQAAASMMVDSVPPFLTLTIPAPNGSNGWFTSGPVTASAAASDATSGLAGTASINGGGEALSVSEDGVVSVNAVAFDVAGNSTASSGTISLDSTPPVFSFSIPAPGGSNGWHISPVTVAANAADATSGIASQGVSLDNNSFSPGIGLSTSGIYTLYGRAVDVAGNAASATTSVKVDLSAPVLGVSLPPAGPGGWYTAQPEVSPAAGDPESGVNLVEYSVDGGGWSSALGSLSDGTHAINVRATNGAGLQGTTAFSLAIDSTPPGCSFSAPPGGSTTTVAGGVVTMSGRIEDATSGIGRAEISLDGGANWAALAVSGGNWSYGWNTDPVPSGTYLVQVRAADQAGNTCPAAGITLVVDHPNVIVEAFQSIFGLPTRTPTATPAAAPEATAAAVPPTAGPSRATPVAPVFQPVTAGEAGQGAGKPLFMAWRMIDPVFLWPALALGSFLAVLGASTFSDQKHKAYRSLQATLERVMAQRLALRDDRVDDDL